MSDELSDTLNDLARTFLNLTPEGRQEFMNKLAESGSSQVSDWLEIFSHYHRNLMRDER